jgi:hypothetical protein
MEEHEYESVAQMLGSVGGKQHGWILINIETKFLENKYFREVLFTGHAANSLSCRLRLARILDWKPMTMWISSSGKPMSQSSAFRLRL